MKLTNEELEKIKWVHPKLSAEDLKKAMKERNNSREICMRIDEERNMKRSIYPLTSRNIKIK